METERVSGDEFEIVSTDKFTKRPDLHWKILESSINSFIIVVPDEYVKNESPLDINPAIAVKSFKSSGSNNHYYSVSNVSLTELEAALKPF
jgi:hypothetical protein